MKKILLSTVFALAAFAAAPAHAALIDIDLGSSGSYNVVSAAGTLNANTNIANLGSALTEYGAVVINPSSSFPGDYQQPTGPIYGNNYLAVLGSPAVGMATLAVTPGTNVFGFTWGSIDTYNALNITTTTGSYTLTGTQLLADIVGGVSGSTQENVQIVDATGTITSVQFVSGENAFEVANISENKVSAVPLPGALPMFLTALAALGLFAYRRNNNAI